MGEQNLKDRATGQDRPSVYLYDDYRLYLRDLFEYFKRTQGISLRKFSDRSGFKSHDMLKKTIDGKRNLSGDGIEKVCKGFNLATKEAQFFTQLVYFNQSKTSSEKRFYAKQIALSKRYQNIHPKRLATYNYFSKWYYVAIREMIALPEFQNDPKWVADTIYPKISVVEAKHALRDLEDLGLIKKNEQGRYEQVDQDLETANQITSSVVLDYHLQMLDRARSAVEELPKEKRNVSGVTMPLSKEKYLEATEMVNQLRQHLTSIAGEDPNPENVYQFNFVIFPLTKGEEAK